MEKDIVGLQSVGRIFYEQMILFIIVKDLEN